MTALSCLATEINEAHAASIAAVNRGVEHARRAGELLLAAKEQVVWGGWLRWLAENCPGVSERMAQNYMRIAREWPRVEAANTKPVSYLPGVKEALAILAKPEEDTGAGGEDVDEDEDADDDLDDDDVDDVDDVDDDSDDEDDKRSRQLMRLFFEEAAHRKVLRKLEALRKYHGTKDNAALIEQAIDLLYAEGPGSDEDDQVDDRRLDARV